MMDSFKTTLLIQLYIMDSFKTLLTQLNDG